MNRIGRDSIPLSEKEPMYFVFQWVWIRRHRVRLTMPATSIDELTRQYHCDTYLYPEGEFSDKDSNHCAG